MKILKTIKKAVVGCCLLGFSSMLSAGVISFQPTPAWGSVGGDITVDLFWTGSVGDYIGGYDVDIAFGAGIVDFSLVQHDLDKGLDSFGAGVYGSAAGAGTLNLAGLSLDPFLGLPGDLETNQDILGNMFRLATITFVGLSEGSTLLSLTANAISDELGFASATTLVNGQICVSAAGAPLGCAQVPAPGTVALFALGLLGLAGSRRKQPQ